MVHKVIASRPPLLAADEDDDDEMVATLGRADDDAADDPGGDLVDLPLRFVGIEFEGHPRGQRRVLDASGRDCDELRLYRWRAHRDGDGHEAERDPAMADLDRQIAAQGWRQERDGYGHMVWVQVADSMR